MSKLALNEDQERRLEECSVLYRPLIRRAYDNTAFPRGAIKAFCIQCVGYVRADVTNCTALACPLWHYRPYQDDAEGDVEEAGVA